MKIVHNGVIIHLDNESWLQTSMKWCPLKAHDILVRQVLICINEVTYNKPFTFESLSLLLNRLLWNQHLEEYHWISDVLLQSILVQWNLHNRESWPIKTLSSNLICAKWFRWELFCDPNAGYYGRHTMSLVILLQEKGKIVKSAD